MDRLRDWTHQVTIVLLVTSVVLIGPGLAGVGSSLLLVAALLALAAVLVAVRDQLGELPTAVGYDLGRYGKNLWLGPLLGAAVALFWLDATPEELQALGGAAGLVGMANYFLRPLYLFVVFRLRRLLDRGDHPHGSGGRSR